MRSVLFVDDEAAALEALRARLHRMRNHWRMDFVDSGPRALAAMQQHRFDVIVSDLRMPGMDGVHLLQTVRERWPETVRIVLSGAADLEQSARLVPIAHQYLSKPCEPSVLESSIERCLALRNLLERPALRAAVGKLRNLPVIPETYARLESAMSNEMTSVSEIADIIACDTAIVAKLLQMVNSAFFRLPRRVATIEQAVSYLGFSTVRNLVLSAEVFSKFPHSTHQAAIDLPRLQKHALRVATATRALTKGLAIADDAMLCALLHDIGYWVLAQEQPDALSECMQLAARESIPLDEAEERVLGASHAQIGAYLLGLWGFSSPVVEAVAHHHAPWRVPQTDFDVLAALSIGHALAEPAEVRAFQGIAVSHPEVTTEYLDLVRAPFGWADAVRLVADTSSEENAANER